MSKSTKHANAVQLILAIILGTTAAFTPAIREFMFNHMQWKEKQRNSRSY